MARKENEVGASLTMDIREMRDGITQLKNHMKTLNLEFQAETAHIDKLNESQEGLEKKLKTLNSVYEDQIDIIAKYEWGIQKAQQANNQVEVERLTNEMRKAQVAAGKTEKEYDKYIKALERLKASTQETISPTDKFKKTISNLDHEIDMANAQFEEAIAGMDDWENSTEGAEAKTKQLNRILDAQNAKLVEVQKEYTRVSREQGENSDEAKKLSLQMSKQRANVKKAEKALADYGKEANDATKENKKLTKSNKELDKSTKEVYQGFTVMKGVMSQLVSRSVVAFVQAIGSSISEARELRKELGMLEATAITTGKAFEQASERLVDVAAITDDTGAALEGMNNLMTAGFGGEQLDQITDQLLGASIKWKDTLKFEGLSDGLQETLATGKAIGPFAELLERAGLNTKKFDEGLANAKGEAGKLNYVLNTLSKLGLSEVRAEYEKINGSLVANNKAVLNQQVAYANLNKILEPIHTAFLNFGTSIINNKIAPAVKEISDVVIKALNGDMVGALEDGTEIFNSIRDTIIEKLIQVGEALPEIIPQIITTFIEGFTTGAGKIVEVLPEIQQIIINIFKSVIDALPDIINTFFDSMDTLFPIILEAVQSILGMLIEALPEMIEGLLEALPVLIERVTAFLVESVPQLIQAAIILLNALVDALPFVLQALMDNLPAIISSLLDFFHQNLPVILASAIDFFMAIADAIPVILGEIVGKLPGLIFAIASGIIEQAPEMFEASLKIFGELIRALGEVIGNMIMNVPQFMASVFEAFMGTLGSFYDIGKNLVEGLWEGIKETGEWLKDKITGFGESITGWFKGIFKIHSPSKLMEDEIGKMLGLGVGEGLLDSTGAVLKDIDKFGKSITKDFQAKVKTINGGLRGTVDVASNGDISGSNASANVNNFTQIINAPKQPSRIELYRQTKNLLAMKGGY